MDHRDMRDIMDHLSDEIMVFDAHYHMVYVNEACRRHYGLPPEAQRHAYETIFQTESGKKLCRELYPAVCE